MSQPEQNTTDFAKEAEALINEYGWLTAKDFEPVLRGIMHGYSLQSQQTASLQKQVEELRDLLERSMYLAQNGFFPTHEFKDEVDKALNPQNNQKEK